VSTAWTIVACLGAAVVAVTVLLLIRRRAPDGGFFNDGDRAAGTFGMLATGFALLLGFVVVLAFESFDQSRTGAEDEALAVAQQLETAQFMPARARDELTGELVCYARYVVEQEWPDMEDGKRPDQINPWGVRMFTTLHGVEPATAAQETAYSKWFDQTTDRESARSSRIHGAEGVIPAPLWGILFLGALLVTGFMLFFADSGERALVQGVQIGAVVLVIGASLAVIAFLQQPFQTQRGGLEPVAMERTLVVMEEALAAVGREVTPPCDAAGAPRT
jgi:hypothetical protein